MIKLITEHPYNSNAPDWRRTFNVEDQSRWEVLPASTVVAIAVPDGTNIVEINSSESIVISPETITVVPSIGSEVTGRFFLNAPVIHLEGETTIYLWARQVTDVVLNFYKG